jgi:hypothetical protein
VAKKNERSRAIAADCVEQWLRLLRRRAAAPAGSPAPRSSPISTRPCASRYIDWRKVQPGKKRGTTISGGTISRELAALRAALRLAWQDEHIPAAPFIPDVPEELKAKPKEEIYSYKQVAQILEAAPAPALSAGTSTSVHDDDAEHARPRQRRSSSSIATSS